MANRSAVNHRKSNSLALELSRKKGKLGEFSNVPSFWWLCPWGIPVDERTKVPRVWYQWGPCLSLAIVSSIRRHRRRPRPPACRVPNYSCFLVSHCHFRAIFDHWFLAFDFDPGPLLSRVWRQSAVVDCLVHSNRQRLPCNPRRPIWSLVGVSVFYWGKIRRKLKHKVQCYLRIEN